jgi:hypothetical protein
MSDNSGIVEPYELLEQASDPAPEPVCEPDPSTLIQEIDLSGYQYDLVLTYKMIEDPNDQDTLFRIQFLQAFGLTNDEYQPEIVSAVINDLYERYYTHATIREIIESHPLFHPGRSAVVDIENDRSDREPEDEAMEKEEANDEDGDDNETSPMSPSNHCSNSDNNSEMIFCMMFSFQLFDLFHACLRHAKHGEDIPQTIRDEIAECFRTMF